MDRQARDGRAQAQRHPLLEGRLQPRVRLLHRGQPRQHCIVARRLRAQADAHRWRAIHHAGAQREGSDRAQRPRADRCPRAGDTPQPCRDGCRVGAVAPRDRARDRPDRCVAQPGLRRGRAWLEPTRGERRHAAPDQRRAPPARRTRASGGRLRLERPRAGPRLSADHHPHRAEHGRQVDLPSAGGDHRPAGAVRELRARRARCDRSRGPGVHAGRRARRHQRRHVDLHGGDDGNGVHPQPRHACLARDLRRGGEGDLDVRRRLHRAGGGRTLA